MTDPAVLWNGPLVLVLIDQVAKWNFRAARAKLGSLPFIQNQLRGIKRCTIYRCSVAPAGAAGNDVCRALRIERDRKGHQNFLVLIDLLANYHFGTLRRIMPVDFEDHFRVLQHAAISATDEHWVRAN